MRLKVSNVCQLLDKSKFPATTTQNGVTFTNNGDGSYAVSGRSTSDFSYLNLINSFKLKKNHIYLNAERNNVSYCYVETVFIDANRKSHWVNRYKADSNSTVRVGLIRLGSAEDIVTLFPQLFDLTEMYGVGNEPTSIEQFRQDFPEEMYEYSPVCWKKFRRLKYVTETKNLFKFSNEVGTLTGGFGPNVARNFEEGKWYIGFTTNNYYSPNNIIAYSFKDNLIYYNGNGAGYGLSRAFKCEPNSNYNISCLTIGISGSGLGYIYAGFYDESGNYISNNNIDINNRSFTTPTNCKWLIITLSTRGTAEVYFKDVQLELGSTATPYQPYGYLPLNRGKYIANKEPVQLLDKSKFFKTSVDYGVTWTNNGDGTITANGTATNIATYTLLVPNARVIPGHKYLFISSITPQQADVATIITNIGGESGNGFIFTTDLTYINIYFYVLTNVTVSNVVFKPQLFDLTEMYGAGNEPATVAQFRADFPNELYDYNPYNAITFR